MPLKISERQMSIFTKQMSQTSGVSNSMSDIYHLNSRWKNRYTNANLFHIHVSIATLITYTTATVSMSYSKILPMKYDIGLLGI